VFIFLILLMGRRRRAPHGADRIDGEAPARDLSKAGAQSVARGVFVGGRFGRIEFQHKVADLHAAAVFDVDGGDLPGIERLDHLGAPGGLDLARRHGRRAGSPLKPARPNGLAHASSHLTDGDHKLRTRNSKNHTTARCVAVSLSST
jgi:hypothetical protein